MSTLNCSVESGTLNYLSSADTSECSDGSVTFETKGVTTCSDNTIGNQTSVGTAGYYDGSGTCWHYWQDYYYPRIIRESYPIYIQEQSKDKGKQAFEIIKMMSDKKFLKLDKVKDFIGAMDLLIKIL